MRNKTHKLKKMTSRALRVYGEWSKVICRVVLAFLLFFPSINLDSKMVEAQDSIHLAICNVETVGPEDGKVTFKLNCKGFKSIMTARKDQQKDMLAVGLTAIAFDKKVTVYYKKPKSGSTDWPEISGLHIMR